MLSEWTFGAWVAGGDHQPLRTRLGHVHDRALVVTGFRATRPVSAGPLVSVRYTVDVLPLVVATNNPEYAVTGACSLAACPSWYLAMVERHQTAYGFGITPVGLETEWFPHSRISFVISAAGGGVYFDHKIPDPQATRFNFTAEGVAGVRLHVASAALTVGMNWYHISNGFTGKVNPAMDSRLLFLGISR